MPAPESTVPIELTQDEAVVLFDFLARFAHERRLEIADPAESRVLWTLHTALERHLVGPLDTRYAETLEAARDRLRERPA